MEEEGWEQRCICSGIMHSEFLIVILSMSKLQPKIRQLDPVLKFSTFHTISILQPSLSADEIDDEHKFSAS